MSFSFFVDISDTFSEKKHVVFKNNFKINKKSLLKPFLTSASEKYAVNACYVNIINCIII